MNLSDRLAGVEWFDAVATLHKPLPKIVSSYALEAAFAPPAVRHAQRRRSGPTPCASGSSA